MSFYEIGTGIGKLYDIKKAFGIAWEYLFDIYLTELMDKLVSDICYACGTLSYPLSSVPQQGRLRIPSSSQILITRRFSISLRSLVQFTLEVWRASVWSKIWFGRVRAD
jgi:hypothetical protein